MLIAPPQHSASLFLNDGLRTGGNNNNNNSKMASPLTVSPDVATPTADRSARRSQPESAFASRRDSGCSLDEMDIDEFTAAFLRGGRGAAAGTPPSPSSTQNSATRRSSSKRKQPQVLKQLAKEFRWMHNNIKHGYNAGGSRSASACATPQPAPEECEAREPADADLELVTMSVRSSLRRPSRSPGSPTSARDHGKVGSPPAPGTAGQSTRWRTQENGEVEAVEAPPLPRTKPDPYAPKNCRYLVRHPNPCDDDDNEDDGAAGVLGGDAALEGGCPTALRQCLASARKDGADLSECSLSASDDGDSPTAGRGGGDDDDSSDVDDVADVGQCPADRHIAKAHRPLNGSPDNMETSVDTRSGDADGYEAFLCGVAHLQRQLYVLEQQTSELRRLYTRERNARVRSRGKGQHLSWTRTVEAANTIQFWRLKVTLLRSFEAGFVGAVQYLQEKIPLHNPEYYATASPSTPPGKADKAAAAQAQARHAFLSSLSVVTAQQQHLRKLGDQFRLCWQDNMQLREELRRLEQTEARVLHDTFSVAGMDAEHFIASLPPRISPYSLCSGSARSSAMSLDNMNFDDDDDDDGAPLLLLTAQNLSPLSDDEAGGHLLPPSALANPSCCGGAVSSPKGLVSCMKDGAAPTRAAVSPSPPSSPKRLKYVIKSTLFDADGDNHGSAEVGEGHHHNNNSSIGGRPTSRGSFASRTTTPLTGPLSLTTDSQSRRRGERHVTFALEPEVLDARPRFSPHGRTFELLEQICMDKQTPWNGEALLQTAQNERSVKLAAIQDRLEDEQEAVLARAVTMTPVCAKAPSFDCETERVAGRSGQQTAPSPTLAPAHSSVSFNKTGKKEKHSKVKPKPCAQCSVM